MAIHMTNPLLTRKHRKSQKNGLGEGLHDSEPLDSDLLIDMPGREAEPVPVQEKFYEEPEQNPNGGVLDLIGDNSNVSDAAAALKAFLGDGDVKASSRITGRQRVAVWDLIHVAEVMNCMSLLSEVESFLLLRISEDGVGREQAIKGFSGLYEPNRNPGNDGQTMPTGQVRSPRF